MTELLPRHRYTEYNGSADGLHAYTRTPEAIGLAPSVPPLRRTEDGLIDYDHYLRMARAERAQATLDIVKTIGRALAALFGGALFGRKRLNRLHQV